MPSGTSTVGDAANIQSRATGSDLPQQVQQAVPSCAYLCLTAYAQQEFPCSTDDYDCLCSRYTSEGLTLGELAFICVNVGCKGQQASNNFLANAYRVCLSDSNAARPTHNTLTPPALQSTATSSSTTLQTSTTTTTSQTSSSIPTAQPETSTIYTASVPSSAAAATTSAAPSRASSKLSPSQAVGVSIAAFGAVLIAIGVVFFTGFYRRRKLNKAKNEKRHSYDFVDDAPPQYPTFDHGHADPQGAPGAYVMPRAEASSQGQKAPQAWGVDSQRNLAEHYQPTREKNNGRSAAAVGPASPESQCSDCSERTTSALLPARPEQPGKRGRFPVKPQVQPPHPTTMHTPATVFEEDRSPPMPAKLVPGLPSHPAVAKAAIAQQNRKSSPPQPQYANEYTEILGPMRHLQQSLKIKIPQQAPRSDGIQELRAAQGALQQSVQSPRYRVVNEDIRPDSPPLPKAALPVPPPLVTNNSSSSSKRDSSSDNGVLSYYTSRYSGQPETTPIDEASQIRRPAPAAITITKPIYPPRAVRGSAISEAHSNRTSFEIDIDDEPTPPEEDDTKQLTPVLESHSPISNIRYPKVPRSSAQMVPRSPGASSILSTPKRMQPGGYQTHESPNTPRGYQTQSQLPGYHTPNQLPFQRASQIGTPNWPLRPQTAEPLQSPTWEPSKLTPRRMGEDMYLAVSAATPMRANF